MKKKLLILFILLCVVIGGYLLFKQYEKNRLVKEAQNRAENVIERNYEEIKSVHMKKKRYLFIPTGALSVDGYVNNDENLYFSVIFSLEGKELGEVVGVREAAVFPQEKEECQNKFCE